MIATPTAFGTTDADAEPACQVTVDWRPYSVQAGDTLLSVALATDTDIIELREANCLSPVSGILPGDNIVVPQLPDPPVILPEPVFPNLARNSKQAAATRCGRRSFIRRQARNSAAFSR